MIILNRAEELSARFNFRTRRGPSLLWFLLINLERALPFRSPVVIVTRRPARVVSLLVIRDFPLTRQDVISGHGIGVKGRGNQRFADR